MGKPIRVAHVMGHMIAGGVEATVMNYYRNIDRSRVQFDFVVDSDSTVVPREEIERLGGRVFVMPPYKNLPKYVNACERLFRERRPDIVHSNINALSVFPLAAAKKAGVPVRIAHSHSTANAREYKKTLVKNLLRPFSKVKPTHLAACSEHAARWLFGDDTVDSGAVRIIRNAIDLDRFSFVPSTRVRKRLDLDVHDDRLVIGQVGRMCFQKNQAFTLDVFDELTKIRPDSLLVYVGEGELMATLRIQARERGVDESVKFLGVRDDVVDLYQAFDVLMFPSTYEGFGMAMVEAQATGLPVICSDQVPREACIVPELVRSLPLGSARQWAQAIADTHIPLDRQSPTSGLDAAGYRIGKEAKTLCDWYESILDERRGVAQ